MHYDFFKLNLKMTLTGIISGNTLSLFGMKKS